jgi:ferredoxin--NADP+ reductase
VNIEPTKSQAAGQATRPLAVAIVGSGPSGFYTAAALLKVFDAVEIDIIEALPTPFGLIRGGVAPDHQSTKAVSRAFTRTALEPRVRYYGNVQLGRDFSLAELRERYDAVVLAVGMALDRPLAIPGAERAGVFGAAAFVGWYNGHPDFRDLAPGLDTPAVCVIGNGNVAIDVARVLVKTPAEMADSDLADYAAQAIQAAPLRDVYLIGRRGPIQAKFTNKELTEMGALADCAAVVDPAQLPEAVTGEMPDRARRLAEKNLATLRGFAARASEAASGATKAKRVHFLFNAQPDAVLGPDAVTGGGRCQALRLERTRLEDGRAVGSGEFFEIPCGLVVSAIGYRMEPIEGLTLDSSTGGIENRDGRVAPGLYATGWAGRGPSGVIGTNKGDGDRTAKLIRADFPTESPTGDKAGSGKAGRAALERLLAERGVHWVGFADWERIDAAEVAAAAPGAPRRKLTRIEDMLAVLA